MKIKIDKQANALYISFKEKKCERVYSDIENSKMRVIPDYNDKDELCGIEILGISDIDLDELKKIDFEFYSDDDKLC